MVPSPGGGQFYLPQVENSPGGPIHIQAEQECHVFCSFQGRERGSLSDAFLLSWLGALMYTFPPVLLLPRVLMKIKQDRVKVILIVAVPTLLDLLVTTLFRTPLGTDLLFQNLGSLLHRNLAALHLMAWLLRG